MCIHVLHFLKVFKGKLRFFIKIYIRSLLREVHPHDVTAIFSPVHGPPTAITEVYSYNNCSLIHRTYIHYCITNSLIVTCETSLAINSVIRHTAKIVNYIHYIFYENVLNIIYLHNIIFFKSRLYIDVKNIRTC